MLILGLEREYFCTNAAGDVQVVPTGVPADECGWLMEARGLPATNPEEAVFSLLADEYRVLRAARAHGVSASFEPVMRVPEPVRRAASRRYAKGLTRHQNLYGHPAHRIRHPLATAGIHVSFTNPQSFRNDKGVELGPAYRIFDFAKLFRAIDQEFKVEIEEARRLPGFYELKPDGRIEHRSLPNNVPPERLIEGLRRALAA